MIEKIKKILNNEEISADRIIGKSINGMTISGDFISVNNKFGHYEIGEQIGKTITLNLEKYKLTFVGGILVEIELRESV